MKYLQLKDHGLYLFDCHRCYLYLWTDFAQYILWFIRGKKYNWWTFNVLRFEIDNEWFTGNHSIEIGLLGFGARFQIGFSTERSRETKADLAQQHLGE